MSGKESKCFTRGLATYKIISVSEDKRINIYRARAIV
jgi:hypothetical protein